MKLLVIVLLLGIFLGGCISQEEDLIDYVYIPEQNPNVTCEYVSWFTNIPKLYNCSDGKEYFAKQFTRQQVQP